MQVNSSVFSASFWAISSGHKPSDSANCPKNGVDIVTVHAREQPATYSRGRPHACTALRHAPCGC